MASRVTIKDVAKLTGLSVGTISNYINGKAVSEKNQETIQAAIDHLGFRINRFARGLRTASSKTIAVLTPDLGGYYISSVIADMEKNLMRRGYRMHIFDYNGEESALKERLTYILECNVEGLVFFPRLAVSEEVALLLNEFRTLNIPVIVASESIPGIEADSIVIDYENSVYETCNMLAGYGHTKIALFTTGRRFAFEKRVMGYKKALEKNSLPFEETLIRTVKYSKTNAEEIARELLANRPDVTALVTVGFGHTLGVIRAIREAGLIIGKDISFVGSDCEDIAGIFVNRLTYVDVLETEMTDNLVGLLMRRIDGNYEKFPQTILLQTKLVEGKSVVDLRRRL